MGFARGVFEEGHFSNFDHAVLRNPSRDIMAFAKLFQGTHKHELSLDLMRYDPEGAGFAMDALFGELMLWNAAEGVHWLSLAAAPFSGIKNLQLASIWNRIGSFVHELGEQLYHFEGLRLQTKVRPYLDARLLSQPWWSWCTANSIIGFGMAAARLGAGEVQIWSEVLMLVAGAVVVLLAFLQMRRVSGRKGRLRCITPICQCRELCPKVGDGLIRRRLEVA